MAQTIPIYIQGDVTNSGTLPASGNQTAAAAITTGSGGTLRAGILWGVHAQLSSTAGQVILRVFNDSSSTRELYSVTLDFSGGITQTSDLMSSAIPLFEAPYFTIESDATTAGKNVNVNFYIQALRF